MENPRPADESADQDYAKPRFSIPPPPPPPLPPSRRAKLLPPPPLPPSSGRTLDSISSAEWKFAAVDNRSLLAESGEAEAPVPAFQPCALFFYGTLMDPDVLQTILALPSPPAVTRGSVSGFRVKMWGIYPTLVPSSPGEEVRGTVWHVSEARHFACLAEYETRAYAWCACEIRREDGEVVAGRTFC
jgi:gamma-glutamylcyclotransferase (GGCT)/AIG2-like uncharacterized protein YtfP